MIPLLKFQEFKYDVPDTTKLPTIPENVSRVCLSLCYLVIVFVFINISFFGTVQLLIFVS